MLGRQPHRIVDMPSLPACCRRYRWAYKIGDLIPYQNDGKYSTADSRKGGEIVSEYSNAWIDMRHDNALNSADW
jgi:hypothetical protein